MLAVYEDRNQAGERLMEEHLSVYDDDVARGEQACAQATCMVGSSSSYALEAVPAPPHGTRKPKVSHCQVHECV